MALPASVDLDRLVKIVLEEMTDAVDWWIKGSPRDEVALMSHVTGRLGRKRRGCDVGVVAPVSVEAKLATLHRQGPKQTDRYGSDLAVTVSITDQAYLKTCFLQFKRAGGDYSVVLEKRQLDDAANDAKVASRAFVAVADEVRGGIRLRPVKGCLAEWPAAQKNRTLDASQWDGLVVWLYKWLRCDIGEASDSTDAGRVEVLLEPYFLPELPPPSALPFSLPADVLPARSWLQLTFTLEEDTAE